MRQALKHAAAAISILAASLVAIAAMPAAASVARVPPASVQGDCGPDTVPIVVASDVAAQSDIYSAVTLAGVIGDACIVLAGARGEAMPADQQTRLDAAAPGGYVVGGLAAVLDGKVAGRTMARLGGSDRWATALLVGSEAADPGSAPTTTIAADVQFTPTAGSSSGTVATRVRLPPASVQGDCDADTVPVVVASDLAAQSDIYSAVTLAGVLGNACVVLAGPRGEAMAANQQSRLDAAASGGYVVGGHAAVPDSKISDRTMARLGGADRWATALLVGKEAAEPASTTPVPFAQYDTRNIRWLKSSNPALYRQIQELPWVRDGIGRYEADSIDWLARMAYDDESAVSQVLDMPFLEAHEPGDAVTLMALYHAGHFGDLDLLLAQPVFEGGIDDVNSTMAIFGSLITTNGGDASALERVLVPGYADVETLSRATALSPHMKVSIIRTGNKPQAWLADAVIDIADAAERLMRQHLPVGHIVMVVSEESACNCTWGFAFDAPFDWEQAKETFLGQKLQGHVAHELFHLYVQGAEWWMYDGTAEAFKYVYGVEQGLDPKSYEAPRGGCEAHDIQMFAQWNPQPGTPRFGCAYFLGGALFRELAAHLGPLVYGSRMRELRRLSDPEEAQKRGFRLMGIDELRRVFASESEIVEKHWSGKLNHPEKTWKLQVSSESHDLIRWDQNPTYDGDSVTFSGTLLGDAVLSGGTIAEALRDGYRNFHLYSVDGFKFIGNINPPGWTHGTRHPGDNTALVYRLEGKTFAVRFRLPEALGNPTDYFVDVWGFRDESRTPVIWQDRDRLGFARIIVE